MRCALVAAGLVLAGCGGDSFRAEWWHASDRLHARAWVGADGYRYLAGWRDVELGLECGIEAAACGPWVTAYYADARCRVFVAGTTGELPPHVVFTDSGGYGFGLEIVGPYQGGLYVRKGECVGAGMTTADKTYGYGRPFGGVIISEAEARDGGVRWYYETGAWASLASAEGIALATRLGKLNVDDGPGRLRTRYINDTDATPLAAGIFDDELGTPCAPAVALDGATRCLPPWRAPLYRDGTAFTDAACTAPVTARLFAEPGFAATGDGYVAVDAPWEGPVFVRNADRCDPSSIPTLYTTGEALAPAVFVALTLEELED